MDFIGREEKNKEKNRWRRDIESKTNAGALQPLWKKNSPQKVYSSVPNFKFQKIYMKFK